VKCVNCGNTNNHQAHGLCAACYRYGKRTGRQRIVLPDGGIVKPLLCDCGKPAVTVKRAVVGINCRTVVSLPLCADCLALENEMENEYA
jgi:hypothetical protein